jgi:hypothetical protein
MSRWDVKGIQLDDDSNFLDGILSDVRLVEREAFILIIKPIKRDMAKANIVPTLAS